MKKRITEMAREMGMEVNDLIKMRNERLKPSHWTGTGGNTYFTDEGQELLRLAKDNPMLVPPILRGFVIHEARNPSWVFAKIDGRDGKVPVAIPRRLRGKLVGKQIGIEAIEDATGITYRHESLAG